MYPHKIMASFPIQCIKVYIQKCILLLLYSYGLFIHIENLKLKKIVFSSTNAAKDVEEKEHLHTVGGNGN
jgi:hypothetical protein